MRVPPISSGLASARSSKPEKRQSRRRLHRSPSGAIRSLKGSSTSWHPKPILFWGALFPQFVDFRADNIILQFAILAITGIAADIFVLSVYAAAAARGGRAMTSGPLAVWRERASGAALIAVGGALSLVGRPG